MKIHCKKIQVPLILIISLSVFLLASLSLLAYKYFLAKSPVEADMKSSDNKYIYINPLLDCADAKIDSFKYGDLTQDIQNIVEKNKKSGQIKEASIYFRDLSNGPWFGYNEGLQFSPASLMKVPLLIAYLKMSEKDSGLLGKKINSGDLNPLTSQNIIPEKSVQANTEYTVLELLNLMIRYSDNSATEVLIENIDANVLDGIYKDLSLKMPSWGNAENYMSVRDYSSFFRILYNASYLNRENSELALEILSESVFEDGLVAGLPKKTQIAHKFGERVLDDSKQLHDCGIIYDKKGDYLLCVMSRGQDFKKMESFLQEISSTVYKSFYE